MPDALSNFSLLTTPQSQQAAPSQVKNSAGGFTFTVGPRERFRRFLILGTESGTYYTGQRELTLENANVVLSLAQTDGLWAVNEIVEVSDAGRAPKNNQALFALALLSVKGDLATRQAAYAALPKVARTQTHLFQFLAYRKQMTGWSAGLRRAVGDWYLNRSPESAARQIVKYGQREGWTGKDVFRKAHPNPRDTSTWEKYDAVFRWAVGKGTYDTDGRPTDVPDVIVGYELAKRSESTEQTARLVRNFGLTWEMIKTEHLNDRKVWEALLESDQVGITALIRQLPRLTNVGLFEDRSWVRAISARLTDSELLRNGRVHPINVLVAMRTYGSGHGDRGSSSWTPVSSIVKALDTAFYAAFEAVEPTGKRRMIALDVSGSMSAGVNGLPSLNCREASAAMAMVTIAREPDTYVVGFTGGGMSRYSYSYTGRNSRSVDDLSVLDLQGRRLDDVVSVINRLDFGGTDCALPMIHAMEKGLKFDSFEVFTDSETWAGAIHPHQALEQYRKQSGINAKLAVYGMASNGFSIANPNDAGMLDVVGLDAAVPGLVNSFIRGDV